MRKTKDQLPWMGRAAVTAIMVLVGLGVFAGSASAQGTTVYDFDDTEAWWNAYKCAAMKVIIPIDTGSITADETAAAHERRVCVMYDDLHPSDQLLLFNFINGDTHESEMQVGVEGWWDANSGDGGTACLTRQKLAGQTSVSASGVVDTGAPQDFCEDYDRLRPDAKEVVDRAGMALAGLGPNMTTTDEAPALPLVGVGLLGVLLAGRGAWLRRRNA